jgi:hypothetical protein
MEGQTLKTSQDKARQDKALPQKDEKTQEQNYDKTNEAIITRQTKDKT